MKSSTARIVQVSIFAIAFAFVESAVVVYLRAIYYPEGLSFPLRLMSHEHFSIEFWREISTMVMLIAVGVLAGSSRWQRFSYFLIAFGVWDIFYYVWLNVLLHWPQTLFDPDILFLLPILWIGPVIAPVAISLIMIIAGVLIIRKEDDGARFHPTRIVWLIAVVATGMILFSFLIDTDATLRSNLPKPYRYELLVAGMILYIIGLFLALRKVESVV